MIVLKKYSETELLAALKSSADIDNAVRYIYREYFEVLRKYTCQNSGSDEDAQDVFQEVVVAFISMVQQDKFRGESGVKTFLYSLNRNIWLNELKKRNRAEKRDIQFESEKESLSMDVSHYIAQNEMQKQTYTILDRLGETCKKILLAYYYDNLSMKEILARLDYENEQVVRNKKSKCLKQLEQLLFENPTLAKTLKTSLYI